MPRRGPLPEGEGRHKVFAAIVQAARKAGETEGLAVRLATQLMDDKRIRIALKQEKEER